MIADMRLDFDEATRSRAMDLFRTTLAKAIFSSPAACLETVNGRIARIEKGSAQGSASDVEKLKALAAVLSAIGPDEFTKYQDLLKLLKTLKWTGQDRRDRLVIFTERIRTVSWLEERLKSDLGLTDEMIGRIDGGSVEADVKTQRLLEDFGQEKAAIRILIASDMASEGLNLHFQSHRLLHFDLPWSLLRFQQRNGRIDRYGQDRPPHIYYFVGESSHPKVRDMWVLEKLVEKDVAAQKGVGDPAVFLGVGDADLEEEVVARAVSAGIGAEAFEAEMDRRFEDIRNTPSVDEELDALFGDYTGVDHSSVSSTIAAPEAEALPRLFADTFDYARTMLRRLAQPEESVFSSMPTVELENRLIRMRIPTDMMSDGGLGYTRSDEVDDRYMPVEAVGNAGIIELTDRADVINTAIQNAKTEERSWPTVQYLWDGHPILGWFGDRAETFFPERTAPLCGLQGRIATGEVAVLLHGAVPNAIGAPIVDRWAVVSVIDGEVRGIETIEKFAARAGLTDNTPNSAPNSGVPDIGRARSALPPAVDAFQSYLVNHRKSREMEIERNLQAILDRLADLEARFRKQLSLQFDDLPEHISDLTISQRRQKTRRDSKSAEINQLFEDWTAWYERTRRMVDDPNPFVEIKAVFVG